VPGLDPVLTERGHRAGDRERLRAVLPAHPADQAVLLKLGQFLVVDPRGLEQLAAGQVGRHAPGATDTGAGTRPPGTPESPRVVTIVTIVTIVTAVAGADQPFPDHLQRKVGIPLHGEDVPEPLDVLR
jgi:hypothetical protein